MRILTVVLLFISGFTASAQSNFGTNNSLHNDSATDACMQNASRLLDEAFVLMQRNYYRKEFIDWTDLKEAARQKLQSRNYCNDAYETINWCFEQMREKHSFIMPTLKAAEYNNDLMQLRVPPPLHKMVGSIHGEWLGDSTAYISIPWVSTTDDEICTQIADSIQQWIALLDSRPVNKWIIDLRKNSGGNCWPMIAGAGPLIGDGICGYFIRNHERVSISYNKGAAMQGKQVRCQVSGKPYQLKSDPVNIIVLTANGTSSSGEIMTLAFKGKENVSFFGEATAGFTTANATYTLSDKSMLVLTVCQEADRTGRVYNGRIIPDFPIASDMNNGDAIKEAAIEWLKKK
jgi:carboxyl-terminal processing protease